MQKKKGQKKNEDSVFHENIIPLNGEKENMNNKPKGAGIPGRETL